MVSEVRRSLERTGSMRQLTLAVVAVSIIGCRIERQPPGEAFADDFQRPALGEAWRPTSGHYRIAASELVVDHAYNHPLWLTKPLPRDAVIELDCWSNDPAGDIKFEAWGDGRSYAHSASYTYSGYVFIFGGWHNQLSAIARMNEHGSDRQTRGDVRVERGRRYHFRIARRGRQIEWQVDGAPFLRFDDPRPLEGPDHAYFGFNDWEAELHFSKLRVTLY